MISWFLDSNQGHVTTLQVFFLVENLQVNANAYQQRLPALHLNALLGLNTWLYLNACLDLNGLLACFNALFGFTALLV